MTDVTTATDYTKGSYSKDGNKMYIRFPIADHESKNLTIFYCDRSYSMHTGILGGENPINQVNAAMNEIIRFGNQDRILLYQYNQLVEKINIQNDIMMTANGSTNFCAVMDSLENIIMASLTKTKVAGYEYKNGNKNSNSNNKNGNSAQTLHAVEFVPTGMNIQVVFMTDGRHYTRNDTRSPITQLNILRSVINRAITRKVILDIKFHVIAFGASPDMKFLERLRISGSTNGETRRVNVNENLTDGFCDVTNFLTSFNTRNCTILGRKIMLKVDNDMKMMSAFVTIADAVVDNTTVDPAADPTVDPSGDVLKLQMGDKTIQLIREEAGPMFKLQALINCIENAGIDDEKILMKFGSKVNFLQSKLRNVKKSQRHEFIVLCEEARQMIDGFREVFHNIAMNELKSNHFIANWQRIRDDITKYQRGNSRAKTRQERRQMNLHITNLEDLANAEEKILAACTEDVPYDFGGDTACTFSLDSLSEIYGSGTDIAVHVLTISRGNPSGKFTPMVSMDSALPPRFVRFNSGIYSSSVACDAAAWRASNNINIFDAESKENTEHVENVEHTNFEDKDAQVGMFKGPDGYFPNCMLPMWLSPKAAMKMIHVHKMIIAQAFCNDSMAFAPCMYGALYAFYGKLLLIRDDLSKREKHTVDDIGMLCLELFPEYSEWQRNIKPVDVSKNITGISNTAGTAGTPDATNAVHISTSDFITTQTLSRVPGKSTSELDIDDNKHYVPHCEMAKDVTVNRIPSTELFTHPSFMCTIEQVIGEMTCLERCRGFKCSTKRENIQTILFKEILQREFCSKFRNDSEGRQKWITRLLFKDADTAFNNEVSVRHVDVETLQYQKEYEPPQILSHATDIEYLREKILELVSHFTYLTRFAKFVPLCLVEAAIVTRPKLVFAAVINALMYCVPKHRRDSLVGGKIPSFYTIMNDPVGFVTPIICQKLNDHRESYNSRVRAVIQEVRSNIDGIEFTNTESMSRARSHISSSKMGDGSAMKLFNTLISADNPREVPMVKEKIALFTQENLTDDQHIPPWNPSRRNFNKFWRAYHDIIPENDWYRLFKNKSIVVGGNKSSYLHDVIRDRFANKLPKVLLSV